LNKISDANGHLKIIKNKVQENYICI